MGLGIYGLDEGVWYSWRFGFDIWSLLFQSKH